MMCPGPEQAAAYADGRLDAAESARLLEHCSDCDDCRRTTAFLSLPHESTRVPADREARALSALRRALDRDRDRTPRPNRRPAPPARSQTSRVGFAIAAALLVGFVGLLLFMTKQPAARITEPREVVLQRDPEIPVTAPKQEAVAPPVREVPAQEPAPKPQIAELPKPAAQRTTEEPRFVLPAEPLVRDVEIPKSAEIKPEEPARLPAHTLVARTLSELQITDITGMLTIHRKGAKTKERLTGVARLNEGDILSAEKAASFQVEGRHPVVLSENTAVSMAYVAQEQAPWLKLHSGEVMVDSTGSSRWVVTDGLIAVAVKPARARFTAARGEARLSLSSLSEPLYVQPDGGDVHAIHPGEELQIGKASAEVKPLDPALAARKNAAFDAARPKHRTIFYTSCDPADAKRDHFFVQEGAWWKNEALNSRERADRTAAAAIGPNPVFAWRETLVVRFRYMTNCRSVELQMRVDEKKYTLFRGLSVDRKNRDAWQIAELPFVVATWQFRRDDGLNQLIVNSDDKVNTMRFVVKPSDVYGDSKPYVLIDDIQVIEKE